MTLWAIAAKVIHFPSLILTQLTFDVFFLNRFEPTDEDEDDYPGDDEDGADKTKRYPGYGIELKVPRTMGPARINITPGKESNCMVEFRPRKNPQILALSNIRHYA